jgi:hypothetical protein
MAQNTTPSSTMTPNAPSVVHSKNARDIPRLACTELTAAVDIVSDNITAKKLASLPLVIRKAKTNAEATIPDMMLTAMGCRSW